MTRPTLRELVTRGVADLAGRLGPFPVRSNEYVLSAMHAGALHGIYGYADSCKRRALPNTADAAGLQTWGESWGVDPLPAVKSSGSVRITVNATTVFAEGNFFYARGRKYVLTASYIFLTAGTHDITAEAAHAGDEYDIPAAEPMDVFADPYFTSRVTNAEAAPGGFTGGFVESTEEYRERVLGAMREPADTGDVDDYVRWALEAPSDYDIYRAWARRSPTVPGQVDVWVVAKPPLLDATPAGLVSDVQSYIDGKGLIGGAAANVAAPTFDSVNISVKVTPPGGGTPSTQTEDEVEAAITALLVAIMEPGDGDSLGTLHRWQIERAVIAAGYRPATVSLPVSIRTTPDYGHVNWLGSLSVT